MASEGGGYTETLARVLRALPWWGVVLLGAVWVALGGVLLAAQFRSFDVLLGLVISGLVVTGINQIRSTYATAPPVAWAVGLGGLLAGGVVAFWLQHSLTLQRLAVLVGLALLVAGALKVFAGIMGGGDERYLLGMSGLTNAIMGLLALSWSTVTILVLAVIFAIRTIRFGLGQITLGLRLRGHSRRAVGPPGRATSCRPISARLTGSAIALGLALGAIGIRIDLHRDRGPQPGPFYTPPSPLPAGQPGTVLRSQVVDGFTGGATTYRVLYLSTTLGGQPVAVSGVISVPDGPAPTGGRKVIALDHGTVGVTPPCGPSVWGAAALPFLEGYPDFLHAGYVVAATDYQGLGTPGPHPYLVGVVEAHNALDIVRAAHNLAEAEAGTEFAVWGHSQGGHASLFTGQEAATYAPDLNLVGVAAGAPAPDLVNLFKANIATAFGKIPVAMALDSWAQVYRSANLNQIVTPSARPEIAKVAGYCMYTKRGLLGTIPSTTLLRLTFVRTPPWKTEPWLTISGSNTPGGKPIPVPILITQGDADTIVDAAVTQMFVDKLCTAGRTVQLVRYPGIGHLDGGQHAVPDVLAFVADRFAGEPAPSSCPPT